MKRLTKKHYKESDGYYIRCSKRCDKDICDCKCENFSKIVDRMGQIKDILGDAYDLDRLRDLVEADKNGRCVVMPCKDWLGIVFGDQEVFYGIDKDYEENPIREISVDSSSRCTWYNGWESVVLKGYDENGFDWEFSPEDIGKTVFLTREAAETALAKEE